MGELKMEYRLWQLSEGTVELHPTPHRFITYLLPQHSQGLLAHQGHLFLPWGLQGLLPLQIPAFLEHLLLLRREQTGRNTAKSVFSAHLFLNSRTFHRTMGLESWEHCSLQLGGPLWRVMEKYCQHGKMRERCVCQSLQC